MKLLMPLNTVMLLKIGWNKNNDSVYACLAEVIRRKIEKLLPEISNWKFNARQFKVPSADHACQMSSLVNTVVWAYYVYKVIGSRVLENLLLSCMGAAMTMTGMQSQSTMMKILELL